MAVLKPTSDFKYTLLGITAILLWSSSVALGRSLAEQIGPITTAACVYCIGGVIGVIHLHVKTGLGRGLQHYTLRYVSACGLLFIIYMSCFYLSIGLSVDRFQVLEVGLINYLWSPLTLLLSIPLLGRRPKLMLLPGIAIATAGVLLSTTQTTGYEATGLISRFTDSPLPYLIALIAAISWAAYSNMSRLWGSETGGEAVQLFMLATGIVLAIASCFLDETGSWSSGTVVELIFLSFSSLLGYICWDIGMKKGDIILLASVSYLTPVLSTVITVFYLSIVPGVSLWIGCLMVVVGAFLCNRGVEKTIE